MNQRHYVRNVQQCAYRSGGQSHQGGKTLVTSAWYHWWATLIGPYFGPVFDLRILLADGEPLLLEFCDKKWSLVGRPSWRHRDVNVSSLAEKFIFRWRQTAFSLVTHAYVRMGSPRFENWILIGKSLDVIGWFIIYIRTEISGGNRFWVLAQARASPGIAVHRPCVGRSVLSMQYHCSLQWYRAPGNFGIHFIFWQFLAVLWKDANSNCHSKSFVFS